MCKLLRVTVMCKLVGRGNTILHTEKERKEEAKYENIKMSLPSC